jgi:hypothetical protein
MKKILVASILGIVATIATANKSQAQGSVFFGNYTGGGATAPVTYTGAASGGFVNGETIGGGAFKAELLYSFGGALGVTYSDTGITASFVANPGDTVANGGGLFGGFGNQVSIPGYTSGTVDFIVQVFNGASYNAATIRGQSGVVTLSTLATAANQLPTGGLMSDNGNATAPLTAFTVAAVPEPTVFAMAGLGAAALMAIRRKK